MLDKNPFSLKFKETSKSFMRSTVVNFRFVLRIYKVRTAMNNQSKFLLNYSLNQCYIIPGINEITDVYYVTTTRFTCPVTHTLPQGSKNVLISVVEE